MVPPLGMVAAFIQDLHDDDSPRIPKALQEPFSLTQNRIEQLRANRQAFGDALRPRAQLVGQTTGTAARHGLGYTEPVNRRWTYD